MVVVGKSEIGVSIPIDVADRTALGIVTISNFMRLPSGTEFLRILKPPNSIDHPAGSHYIGCAIVVHVNRPLAAVGNKLAKNSDLAKLMPRPHSSIRARIF